MSKLQQHPTAWLDLTKASEGGLLEFALALYRIHHPNEKPKYVFAEEIGKTEAHLDQCLADTSHIGIKNWIKIQKLLPMKLFDIWVGFQQEQMDFKESKMSKP
jgi:hypothetical protein